MVSSAAGNVPRMDARELFLVSDASLRSVFDRMSPADLDTSVPPEWSSGHRSAALTMRDIVARHTYDEAWIPDVVAGRTAEDVGDRWDGILRGAAAEADPVASYDTVNDLAAAAMSNVSLDPEPTLHFGYGDYPFSEGVLHLVTYRAFQAWQIAHLLGIDFHFAPEQIDAMNELLLPIVPMLRGYGVFPPEIDPPAGADAETRLLCAVGYWVP
jgi:hypothetical protein